MASEAKKSSTLMLTELDDDAKYYPDKHEEGVLLTPWPIVCPPTFEFDGSLVNCSLLVQGLQWMGDGAGDIKIWGRDERGEKVVAPKAPIYACVWIRPGKKIAHVLLGHSVSKDLARELPLKTLYADPWDGPISFHVKLPVLALVAMPVPPVSNPPITEIMVREGMAKRVKRALTRVITQFSPIIAASFAGALNSHMPPGSYAECPSCHVMMSAEAREGFLLKGVNWCRPNVKFCGKPCLNNRVLRDYVKDYLKKVGLQIVVPASSSALAVGMDPERRVSQMYFYPQGVHQRAIARGLSFQKDVMDKLVEGKGDKKVKKIAKGRAADIKVPYSLFLCYVGGPEEEPVEGPVITEEDECA